MVLTGPDGGVDGTLTFTITAVGTGQWTFDWSFDNQDTLSSGADVGGYLINGTEFQLADDDDSGSLSVVVTAGDIIGFYAFTTDGSDGPGVLTVTNVVFPG